MKQKKNGWRQNVSIVKLPKMLLVGAFLMVTSIASAQTLDVTLTPFEYNGSVNIRCYGTNTGRVFSAVTGGTGPYTYSWSAGFAVQGGATAVGLFAGPVSLTVTDALGATVTETVTLIQNPPLESIATWSPILCYGGLSTVTVNAAGGTAPYSGTTTTSVTVGTYIYTVADANGCRDRDTITIDQPDILDVTATPTAILCFGDSSDVTVAATGGTMPYTGTGIVKEVAGTYMYTVVDANGCSDGTQLAINQPGALTAMVSSTPILCNGGTSLVTVTVASGVEPYTGTGLYYETAGTYTYLVYDYNLCEDSVTVTITEPAEMISSISATPILCNGGTTDITVSGSGGTGTWVGTGTFTELAGTYDYTLTDANGCTDSISITVTEPTQLTASISSTAIVCTGGTSYITVSAAGGTPPYMGTGVYGVTAGTHTYTVTDANGCTVTISTTVTEPASAVFASATSGVILCYGDSTDVTVSATGGTAPYSGIGLYTGVPAGNHTYTVTDANGCTDDVTINIAEPDQVEANITPQNHVIDCIPIPVTLYANPSGGTAPYTYLWSDGSTGSSVTVNPNETTVYSVQITDANGCAENSSTNETTVTVTDRCGKNNNKVLICHVPSGNPSNGQTICISPNALSPHLSNLWNLHGGDYCGPCQSNAMIISDNTNLGDNSFIRAGFNTNTDVVELSYRLGYDSDVRVEIYDMTGALVEVIHDNRASEGELYEISVMPNKFTTGVYIYQFVTDRETHIEKLQFIK